MLHDICLRPTFLQPRQPLMPDSPIKAISAARFAHTLARRRTRIVARCADVCAHGHFCSRPVRAVPLALSVRTIGRPELVIGFVRLVARGFASIASGPVVSPRADFGAVAAMRKARSNASHFASSQSRL